MSVGRTIGTHPESNPACSARPKRSNHAWHQPEHLRHSVFRNQEDAGKHPDPETKNPVMPSESRNSLAVPQPKKLLIAWLPATRDRVSPRTCWRRGPMAGTHCHGACDFGGLLQLETLQTHRATSVPITRVQDRYLGRAA